MRTRKSIFKILASVFMIQLMFLGTSCAQEGKEHREEGEEDGTQYGIKESYEGVRNGVHMTLAYNAEKDSFVGIVKNTTKKVIRKVRVEVHLSNGVELGPTPRADLKPGKSRNILLSVKGNKFETWSTHAESGNEEAHGTEGEEAHSGREKNEHNDKKENGGEHN